MILHAVEQRSEEWYALRLGKPTASEFSKIVTSKGEPSKSASTYAITLAIELYAGKTPDAWEGNTWTERGRELEDEAIARYEFDRDVEITKTGFVTDDDRTMGCSPDGLVGSFGLIEVKCLKAENHVRALMRKDCPPDYIAQVQGQMMICKRDWCDLVFHHPELPMAVKRQHRDEKFIEALRQEIPALLAERDRVLEALR
ncbi:MAG: lambda exonuclease family protein [Paracoccaceae bacterium]